MRVKTNVRAGSGSAADTSTSVSTQNQGGKGGAKSGGAPVVYYPPVSRCVGI